ILFGIVISIILIVIISLQINLKDVFNTLKKTNYLLIIISMLVFLFSFVFRAMVWHYVLYEVKDIKFTPLFSSMMIGFMANCIFPARLGEIIMGYLISRYARISKTCSIASVIITRIFDAIVILIIWLGLLVILGYKKSDSMWMAGFIGVIVYAGIGLLVFLFYKNHKFASRLIERFFALFSLRMAVRVRKGIAKFVDGMTIFKSPKRSLISFFLMCCVWGTIALSTWLVIKSFHFGEIMPYYTPFVVTALIAIGISIPSSPGYIGTFEVSSVFAIRLSNSTISGGEALTFSILLHLSQLIPVIIVGFINLWTSHLRLSQIAITDKNSDINNIENSRRIK
ncbi:MAG: lysylphosphatidylglycerol synthase transmembrane domain-containing protein, partial [Thermodesulfovibrionales bacterium]